MIYSNLTPGMIPAQPVLSEDQVTKLYLRGQEHAMAVEEHRAKKAIDDDFEARRQARYQDYRIRRSMASVVVSERPDGSFWYNIDVEGSECRNKEVFPTTSNFCSRIYTSSNVRVSLMEIGFDRGSQRVSFRLDPFTDTAVKTFKKKLLSKAVGINVGRTLCEEVLTQVLSMLVKSASTVELPLHHGWNRKANGSFEFIGLDQLTLEEVIHDGV